MSVNPFLTKMRRTVRAPINPVDKATIVSIFPLAIIETKPTIFPGRFHVPGGTFEKPGILVVGPSSWWRDVDPDQPLIEIPVTSTQVADSVVKDWANGLFGCNMTDRMPGIFYIPGEFTVDAVRKTHPAELLRAQGNQNRWFEALISAADSLWARSNGNPRAIDDNMRLAAKMLGRDKPWIKDFQVAPLEKCIACQTLIPNNVLICPNCKVVLKPEEFKKLGLSFAS